MPTEGPETAREAINRLTPAHLAKIEAAAPAEPVA
jgi:hypothetical protein